MERPSSPRKLAVSRPGGHRISGRTPRLPASRSLGQDAPWRLGCSGGAELARRTGRLPRVEAGPLSSGLDDELLCHAIPSVPAAARQIIARRQSSKGQSRKMEVKAQNMWRRTLMFTNRPSISMKVKTKTRHRS